MVKTVGIPPYRLSCCPEVASQAMRLRLVRPCLEDGPHLAERSVRVTFVEEGLGEDQTGGHVLGKALQALPAETDRVPGAARLAVGIGQGGEGQRCRIFGQPFLVAANRAEGRWVIRREGPADRGDRVSHPSLVIRGGRG